MCPLLCNQIIRGAVMIKRLPEESREVVRDGSLVRRQHADANVLACQRRCTNTHGFVVCCACLLGGYINVHLCGYLVCVCVVCECVYVCMCVCVYGVCGSCLKIECGLVWNWCAFICLMTYLLTWP